MIYKAANTPVWTADRIPPGIAFALLNLLAASMASPKEPEYEKSELDQRPFCHYPMRLMREPSLSKRFCRISPLIRDLAASSIEGPVRR